MNLNELCVQLRKPYKGGNGGGVVKLPAKPNIWFVIPPKTPRERPSDLPLKAIGRAHKVLEQLSSIDKSSPIDQFISRLLLRREALSSSRMEGTWSTIDHVLTPQLAESEMSGHASVRSYAKGLEKYFGEIRKKKLSGLTVALIKGLHKTIMANDPNFQGVAGRFRLPGKPGEIVHIGGSRRIEDSIFNPMPAQYVSRFLKDLMGWYSDSELVDLGDAGQGLTLPLRLAIGHAHFEAIHPFPDGNGRVGRMLWPLQMLVADKIPLYLSGYVEANKAGYGNALQVAQKQLKYGPIIEFICDAITESYVESEATRDVLKAFPSEWRKKGKFRAGSGADKAVDILIASPILSTTELSHKLKISFQAASVALKQLTSAEIVGERTGYGRNRIFAAEEVISVLARPFGQDPKISLEAARLILENKKR